ncbi:MAG: AAA family ATPase [Anaeroplasmataceae bacterium]|nr:AAA family ATPase [Anaeroplasmataceae bacterium]
MRIYLIGLPGVGKSSVGKKLASKMGYEYIDLDEYIEYQATLFVDEIFKLYGEEYFRALESNCLKELSTKEHIVISCGGGIIKTPKNKDLMDGLKCYLTAPLDEIEKRLEHSSIVRPILQSKSLKDLYLERKTAYENFADFMIENVRLEDTVEKIIKVIGEKNA